MRIRIITSLSILCILLVFAAQAYVVYTNFELTIDFTSREVNTVLNEAFKKELNIRQKLRQKKTKIVIIPPPTEENLGKEYNVDAMGIMNKETDMHSMDNNDVTSVINTIINKNVSEDIPLNLQTMDSLTFIYLHRHKINTEFAVNLVDHITGIIKSSKQSINQSGFLISSKLLPLDLKQNTSLQLVLINPLKHIIMKMGILLLSTLLLSLLCFYGLWYLHRMLARQKKLMKIKNDFFGNTAHELKRPVAQLQLALEALSKPATTENATVRERYMSISKEATTDMSEKITMILTLSMAEEGVFKLNYSEFNLLEVVHKTKDQFSAITQKAVNITVEGTDDCCTIYADKDHIRQCLANLLDNAIKYSGESVTIAITLQKLHNSFCLSVKDNGIGIENEKVHRIFEKYLRLNTGNDASEGFGIGLSYVRAVVEKHKGRIEVKSEIDKGSEFLLYIPTSN